MSQRSLVFAPISANNLNVPARHEARMPCTFNRIAFFPSSGVVSSVPQRRAVPGTSNEGVALTKALAGIRWEVIFMDDDSAANTADEIRAIAQATQGSGVSIESG